MSLVKFLLKILLKTTLGAAVILVINLTGQLFGFHAPFNIVSSLAAGILGIPGLILIILFSSI